MEFYTYSENIEHLHAFDADLLEEADNSDEFNSDEIVSVFIKKNSGLLDDCGK